MARNVRHFILHFIEMCLAMCIGGIGINVLFFEALALFGVTYSEDRLPAWALLAIGINLGITMTAWMRFRRHDWRSTLEMASTSILLAIGVIATAGVGAIDESDRLDSIKALACPVMLIPMLLRWNLCSGSHQVHGRSTAA